MKYTDSVLKPMQKRLKNNKLAQLSSFNGIIFYYFNEIAFAVDEL